MKFLIPFLIVLAGCGLQGRNPEERSDLVAQASLESIHLLQVRARNLYDVGSLSPEAYRQVLLATGDLTGLVARIESAVDVAAGSAITVECAEINLGGEINTACNREDITKILIRLRDALDESS